MVDTLKLYKEFERKGESTWEIASALNVYNCIDAIIEEPTEEEYQTIFNVCYKAYMKASDNINLIRLADGVCEEYKNRNITLSEIKNMSERDILQLEKL